MVDLNNDTVTKHTGWLVLQRMQHHDGKDFTASSLFETKTDAEMYASAFDNIVAIMPIEWNAAYRTSVSSQDPIHSKARINWFILESWSVALIIGLAFWAGVIALFM